MLHKCVDENKAVEALAPYGAVIPASLIPDYVSTITLTYVGYNGYSCQWSRRDFYADLAALRIPKMIEKFDDTAAAAFVEVIRTNSNLWRRIQDESKLGPLRTLAEIVLSPRQVAAGGADRSGAGVGVLEGGIAPRFLIALCRQGPRVSDQNAEQPRFYPG